MGHRLSASEETAALRQATREAHEAMQGLRDLLRAATALTVNLTTSYQEYHDRELKELANALNVEHNQVSRDLNASIEAARRMISEQIMSGKAVFDRNTSTVSITWGLGAFDEHVPPPYPEVTPREAAQ